MVEFKNKNDYSVIFFYVDREPLKWTFVHDVKKACKDVVKTAMGKKWMYANVYVRRSGRFLKRYYENDKIESHPK